MIDLDTIIKNFHNKSASAASPELSDSGRPELSLVITPGSKLESLSAPQVRAVAALLQSSTQESAAAAAKISVRTLARWLQLPAFQEALQEARNRIFNEALQAISLASTEAIAVLRKELSSRINSDRIRAAQAILRFAFRARELTEHEERLAAIEAKIESAIKRRVTATAKGKRRVIALPSADASNDDADD